MEDPLDRCRHSPQSPHEPAWEGFTYLNISRPEQSHQDRPLLANKLRQELTFVESSFSNDLTNSLVNAQVGDRVRILSLNCGTANPHLMEMGLLPGAVLKVISSSQTGSVIVALRDRRLGLGPEMAQQIQVAPARGQAKIKPESVT